MNIIEKIFLGILKAVVLALLFYPAFNLATWGAIGVEQATGFFILALLFSLFIVFAYLKFAVWLIGLGSADKKKDEEKKTLKEVVSDMSEPVTADTLYDGIKLFKRLLSVLAVLVPAVFLGLAIMFPKDAARFFEMRKFDRYCSQADEFIAVDFPMNETKYRGFMRLNTPFTNPTFIIDYDEMRVSFDSGSRDFSTYELSKSVPAFSDLDLQSEKSLSSPGKAFRTYFKKPGIHDFYAYSIVTYGIEIELENGEVWRVRTSERFFTSENGIPIVYDAVQNCDERIEFGDEEFPINTANVTRPTLFIDYDKMEGLLVYNTPGGYEFLNFTEFDYINDEIPELNIIAKIEAKSPYKEIYVYHCTYLKGNYYVPTRGFALVSEDGKLYVAEKSGKFTYPSTYGIENSYPFNGDATDILKSIAGS